MGRVKPVYVETVPFEQYCKIRYSFLLETEEVVAIKDIPTNTWIDASSPLWTFVNNWSQSDYAQWRQDLVASFNRYVAQSECLVAHSNGLSPPFRPPMTRDYWIEQMWRTNSWQSKLQTKQEVVSVVNGSKFNHSCDANLYVYVDHTQFRCRTIGNIRAGDILTVSYLGNKMQDISLDDRRDSLMNWNFKCTCTRCEVEETVLDMISQLEHEQEAREQRTKTDIAPGYA
jgi:hypothetical protein